MKHGLICFDAFSIECCSPVCIPLDAKGPGEAEGDSTRASDKGCCCWGVLAGEDTWSGTARTADCQPELSAAVDSLISCSVCNGAEYSLQRG